LLSRQIFQQRRNQTPTIPQTNCKSEAGFQATSLAPFDLNARQTFNQTPDSPNPLSANSVSARFRKNFKVAISQSCNYFRKTRMKANKVNAAEKIETVILTLRKQKIIVDTDLARIYGAPTFVFN
jgi:hypothetical protein